MVKKQPPFNNLISANRQARHHYTIDKTLEAGIALSGWEVKSIRSGRCQLKESYVQIRDNEAWLVHAHISPLSTASSHIETDPLRPRKLLLHYKEIKQLIGSVKQQGYSIIPLKLYWKNRRLIKLEIAIGKGKKLYDKRMSEKEKTLKKEAWRR